MPRRPRPTARPVAACAVLAGILAAACGGGPDRPNVVLITLDTTRPDYMSTYGYTPGHTPSFDALAAEGARFDMAISSSAVTPVSHATILTGRFQYNHGLRVLSAGSGFRLPESETPLATTLKAQGYTTVAVHSALPVSGIFGFDRDFDVFESFDGQITNTKMGASWDTERLQRRSDQTTEIALREVAKVDGPFFLWVHYWDPHDVGLLPPKEYLSGVPLNNEGKVFSLEGIDAAYPAEVRFLDAQFGRLLAGLRDLGVYDDSFVFVTSDHGEGLADGKERHDWRAHRMVYQEQIRVPLIVRGPGIAAGVVVDALVRTADIVPTLLDYLGLGVPGDLDGRTLRPLLENAPDEPRVAYADQINGYDHNAKMTKQRPDAAFLYCVIDGDWKLTYRPHDPVASELFNLRDDPGELTNLFPKEREVWLRLLGDIAARQPWVWAEFPDLGDLTPEQRAAMERAFADLGYAGEDVAETSWTWTCPEHPEYRLDGEARATKHEACGRILVQVLRPE